MRHTIVAVIAALSVAGCSDAAGPAKLWETAGFDTPESVLPSSDGKMLYVSNVAGQPDKKDGNGFISRVTPDGKIETLKWVEGLDAPKGMAIHAGKLYVADIDQLVEIDIASGKIAARYPGEGGKFFNDLAVDPEGRIYVADTGTNRIWRLESGKFELWLDSAALKNPNGLLIEGDNLIVGAWGVMTDGWATKVPGNLLTVSLTDKSVKDLGDGKPVGNLDGLEPLGGGTYLVSDWMAGKVYRIESNGKADVLLTLSQGTADLAYVPGTKTMIIPLMKDGKLVAYRLE